MKMKFTSTFHAGLTDFSWKLSAFIFRHIGFKCLNVF